MNDEILTPDDERLLDRLVDGELTETERNELLLRLERSPGGWRHCALAFLEAQSWRYEAQALMAEPPPVAPAIMPASLLRRRESSLPWTMFSVAGCALVAFGTWAVIRDKDGNGVAHIELPEGGNVQVVADGQPPMSQNLRLRVDGGPNQKADIVEVPLVDARRMNEALFGPNVAIPPEIVRMLEQAGHQVVRERRLVPVDLHDGRRVVVPMDQVEIRPVSNRGFQ